jgi:hypothetical protein
MWSRRRRWGSEVLKYFLPWIWYDMSWCSYLLMWYVVFLLAFSSAVFMYYSLYYTWILYKNTILPSIALAAL